MVPPGKNQKREREHENMEASSLAEVDTRMTEKYHPAPGRSIRAGSQPMNRMPKKTACTETTQAEGEMKPKK